MEFYYVDTASTAGTQDGASRTHGNSGTAAFESLFTAEATLDADATYDSGLVDDMTIKCAGTLADTTAVTWNAFGSDATYTLTIQGDDGADDSLVTVGADDGTAYNDDGRYTGPLDWSTSHYRMMQGATSYTFQMRVPFTVDGLQVECSLASVSAAIYQYNATSGNPEYIIENCRLVNTGNATNAKALIPSNGTVGSTVTVRNCIITKPVALGMAVDCLTRDGVTDHYSFRNCTFYGPSTGSGVRMYEYGTSSAGTFDMRNCVIGNTANDQYKSGSAGLTVVTGGYNGSDDNTTAGGPNTGDFALGTHTDEWADPDGTDPGDFNFTPLVTSGLHLAADRTYAPTLDINGRSRALFDVCSWGMSWGTSWGSVWTEQGPVSVGAVEHSAGGVSAGAASASIFPHDATVEIAIGQG